jgi:hypothetical protein
VVNHVIPLYILQSIPSSYRTTAEPQTFASMSPGFVET